MLSISTDMLARTQASSLAGLREDFANARRRDTEAVIHDSMLDDEVLTELDGLAREADNSGLVRAIGAIIQARAGTFDKAVPSFKAFEAVVRAYLTWQRIEGWIFVEGQDGKLYPELVTLVARPDAGLASAQDLKGKRLNIGAPGSGTRATWEVLKEALGITEKDLAEAAAFDLLHHEAEDVRRHAVLEHGAGRVHERGLRHLLEELRGTDLRRLERPRVLLAHGTVRVGVGEAGRVPHQVVDVDGLLRGLERHLAVGPHDAHLLVLERGQVLVEAALERKAPLLVERERGHARHDLGHRGEVEDRVERHRRARGLVEMAVRLVVDEPAVARDGDHGARHPVRPDLAGEEGVDAREALLREAGLLGSDGGQGRGGESGAAREGGEQRGDRLQFFLRGVYVTGTAAHRRPVARGAPLTRGNGAEAGRAILPALPSPPGAPR